MNDILRRGPLKEKVYDEKTLIDKVMEEITKKFK